MKYLNAILAATFSLGLMTASAFGAPLTLSTTDVQVVPLGISQDVEVTLTAGADFKGDSVELGLDRTELSKIDDTQDIAVQLEQPTVPLKAGQSVKVNLTITVSASSHSFDMSGVMLMALGSDKSTVEGLIPISVPNVLEIRLYEGHKWSAPKDAVLRSHKNGVTVRFINYDETDEHLIHGQGAIPHANDQMTPAKNGVPSPGGTYEFSVTSTKKISGLYYCHDHESSAVGKTITFNGL